MLQPEQPAKLTLFGDSSLSVQSLAVPIVVLMHSEDPMASDGTALYVEVEDGFDGKTLAQWREDHYGRYGY